MCTALCIDAFELHLDSVQFALDVRIEGFGATALGLELLELEGHLLNERDLEIHLQEVGSVVELASRLLDKHSEFFHTIEECPILGQQLDNSSQTVM